ncbi:hypothetical protein L7F22_045806 [Adiantum nelumboides]|nr:hypothetical protein [Adiantum nelumboides]
MERERSVGKASYGYGMSDLSIIEEYWREDSTDVRNMLEENMLLNGWRQQLVLAHGMSACHAQAPQFPSRIASLGNEESMEPCQVDSQLAILSYSSEVVPSTQTHPSSMSPFWNTFSSMMHATLFEPPPSLAMPILPNAQVPTFVAPTTLVAHIHDSQQHMVAPVHPPFATTVLQPRMTSS